MRRPNRGLNSIAFVLLGLAAVLCCLYALMIRSELSQEEVTSQSFQVASRASQIAAVDLRTALHLAVYAHKLHPSPETRRTLFDLVVGVQAEHGQEPVLLGFLESGTDITAVGGSTDARFLVAGTQDGRVIRWRLPDRDGEVLGHLDAAVDFAWISEDGETVVASSTVTEGTPAKTLTWSKGVVEVSDYEAVAVSPSASTVVSTIGGRTVLEDGPETVIVEVRRGEEETLLIDTGMRFMEEIVLADDRIVIASSYPAQVARIDTDSGVVEKFGIQLGGRYTLGMALSADGEYVTGSNSLPYVELWKLDESKATDPFELEPVAWAAPLGDTPVDIALSPDATRVATARNGVLGISAVSPSLEDVEGPVRIEGAGVVNPGTLTFLGNDYLVVGSGSRVGLWSVNRSNQVVSFASGRIAQTVAADVPSSFPTPAHGPQEVLVNPSGSKALVVRNDDRTGVVVDFKHGTALPWSFEDPREERRSPIEAAVWLDDDRLFTAANGEAFVLAGPSLSVVIDRWALDWLSSDAQLSVRASDDGEVFITEGDTIVRVNVNEQRTDVINCATGQKALGQGTEPLIPKFATAPESGSTRLRVCDLRQPDSLLDVTLEGPSWIVASAWITDTRMAVWSVSSDPFKEDATGQIGESTLWEVDLDTGNTREVGPSIRPGGSIAEGGGMLATSHGDWGPPLVQLIDARDGVPLTIAEVPQARQEWTAVGISQDGTTLVYTNEPTGTITAVPISPDLWIERACQIAGTDLTSDEFSRVMGFAPDDIPTCRNRSPS